MAKEQRGGKTSRRTSVTTTETAPGLTAEEERLLRMRHGLPVAPETRVAQPPMGLSPHVLAELHAIERRALQESGRLEALDTAAARELGEPCGADTKAKIIEQLGSRR